MYVPKSNNPLVTTPMLQKALWQVRLEKAPQNIQKQIDSKLVFRLVIDDARRKLLAFDFNDQILFSLDCEEIDNAFCIEANETAEYRHRSAVLMKNGEGYRFYVNSPFNKDISVFIYRLGSQVKRAKKYAENPNLEKTDKKLASILSIGAGIVFLLCTIANWASGDNVGWGIFTLFFSIICFVGGFGTMQDK